MSDVANYLAVDLGASSGRVMLGTWDGVRFDLHELHRFPNGPVAVQGELYWDVLRLWHEINSGIARYAAQHEGPLAGIGIDTWAADYGLLDGAGRLLGSPYHYRDRRTTGMIDEVDAIVPAARLYAQTGIGRLPFNTIYQLYSQLRSGDPQLHAANKLLLIPDLLHYWLSGEQVAEYTNATTTGLLDAASGDWAGGLLEELGLRASILPRVVAPGTLLGELLPDVRERNGLRQGAPVIAVGTHDTASAVAAVPGLDNKSMYISSGTWSLAGIEASTPILSERARELNFTNEGGVGGTIRFLKNVGGLWLLQESLRGWRRAGQSYNWHALEALAAEAPALRSLIDPDAPDFLSPDDMPQAIRTYSRRSGQPEPASVGEIVRACLESLALRYRWVLRALEELAGHRVEVIRIVGGGSQNRLLCQWTADACNRPVVAGPVEATALGNIMLQAVATGALPDLAAGRRAIEASFHTVNFTPEPSADWDAAFARFESLLHVEASGA